MSNALENLVDTTLEDRGLTRDDLAATLGVSRTILDEVLAYTEPLGLDDAMALARALGVTLDSLGEAVHATAEATGVRALEASRRL